MVELKYPVEIIYLQLEERDGLFGKNYIGGELPFLKNDPALGEGYSIRYVGKRDTLKKLKKIKSVSERQNRVKNSINSSLFRELMERSGRDDIATDLLLGVAITKEITMKDTLQNATVFKVVPEEGDFLILYDYVDDYYDSNEMKRLDENLKNKPIDRTGQNGVRTYFAGYLLEVLKVKDMVGGRRMLVLANYGKVIENDTFTYNSKVVIDDVSNPQVGSAFRKLVGSRPFKPEKVAERSLDRKFSGLRVVDVLSVPLGGNAKVYMRKVLENGIVSPFFLRSHRVANPKNRRITFTLRAYEMLDNGRVRPIPKIAIERTAFGTIESYNPLGYPTNISGRSFLVAVVKHYLRRYHYDDIWEGNNPMWHFEVHVGRKSAVARSIDETDFLKVITTSQMARPSESELRMSFISVANIIDSISNLIRSNIAEQNAYEIDELVRGDEI